MKRITIIGNALSDNHVYGHRAFGKRVLKYMTKAGKDYKKLVDMTAKEPYEPFKEKCGMVIKVFFGDKRKRDVQGCLKILIDALQGIFYEDDNQIVYLQVEKYYDKEFPRSEVEVWEIEELDYLGASQS